jgi:SAM-dependent methyltransferase
VGLPPLLYEVFEPLPRQGPGDDASTARAFSMIPDSSGIARVLDIGCGSGKPTLTLAKITKAQITALDNHAQFLRQLEKSAKDLGFQDRIRCVEGDMTDLKFEAESFDLIWSEGVIGIMGMKNACRAWRPLLASPGYLVVSDLVRFRDHPPEECRKFWEGACPFPLMNVPENIRTIERGGFKVLQHFPLPELSWWNPYYTPMEKRIQELRAIYKDDSEANELLDMLQQEVDIFRRYPGNYGYEFFVSMKA